MDFGDNNNLGGRPYTAAGSGANPYDRVSYNINRAESLLDEPDTGFSLGAPQNMGRMGSGGQMNQGSLIGQATRSNHTGSEFGDSDNHSGHLIGAGRQPRWAGGAGSNGTAGGSNGAMRINDGNYVPSN